MSATASDAHAQAAYRVRFDWGLSGARALVADARPGDVAVVVDVLSFTTTLTVAVEHGVAVFPYTWANDEGPAYAAGRDAVLAVGRRTGRAEGRISLSPGSFVGVTGVERVVLPSPNGSTISFALAESGARVVGASLRNASAVGRRLAGVDGRVTVIAAGERWPDRTLRPAIEDLWGAGAVLAALSAARGEADASPEARGAAAAFAVVRDRVGEELTACASGRELAADGFAGDVALAAAYDASEVVPVLEGLDDAFRDVQDW